MNKLCLLILSVMSIGALAFCGCSRVEDVKGHATLADEGVVSIDGIRSFYYELFDGKINEAIVFHDVTFTESYYVQNGTTISQVTVPLMYNISIEFGDGTTEILRFVGLPVDDAIDVNLTKYDKPQAGVMMVTNNMIRHIYILVATTISVGVN